RGGRAPADGKTARRARPPVRGEPGMPAPGGGPRGVADPVRVSKCKSPFADQAERKASNEALFWGENGLFARGQSHPVALILQCFLVYADPSRAAGLYPAGRRGVEGIVRPGVARIATLHLGFDRLIAAAPEPGQVTGDLDRPV